MHARTFLGSGERDNRVGEAGTGARPYLRRDRADVEALPISSRTNEQSGRRVGPAQLGRMAVEQQAPLEVKPSGRNEEELVENLDGDDPIPGRVSAGHLEDDGRLQHP